MWSDTETRLSDAARAAILQVIAADRDALVERATELIYDASSDLRGIKPRRQTYRLVSKNLTAVSRSLELDASAPITHYVSYLVNRRAWDLLKLSTLQRGFLTVGRVVMQQACDTVSSDAIAGELQRVFWPSYERVIEDISDGYAAAIDHELHHRSRNAVDSLVALPGWVGAARREFRHCLDEVTAASEALQRRGDGPAVAGSLPGPGSCRFVEHAGQVSVVLGGLLRLAEAASGAALARRAVDLSTVMAEVCRVFGSALNGSSEVSSGSRLPVVEASPPQMYVLLREIVDNAVRFRDVDRPPMLRVGVQSNADAMLMTFSDNGVGLGAHRATELLKPFRRGDAGAFAGDHRAGVGLAMCKSIVEQHGGELELRGLPVGACVSISWPLTGVHESSVSVEPASGVPAFTRSAAHELMGRRASSASRGSSARRDRGQAIRVAMIDDDEDDRLVVKRLLSRTGGGQRYELSWFQRSADGLDALRARRHDVYLIDYRIDERSGLDILHQLRREQIFAPVVLVTGQGGREIDDKALEAGASDYLVKGRFDGELLERSIRYAMSRHQLIEALQDSEARLRSLVARDELTGLYSRRYFLRRLKEEVALAHRARRPLSVCIADLDRFKRINDEYGHLVGDRALVAFGKVLDECTRLEDIVGRYGGDEIMVMFPNTAPEDALTAIERGRQRLHQTVVRATRDDSLALRASIGLAQLCVGQSADELLAQADAALYQAKAQGRDRVVVSER